MFPLVFSLLFSWSHSKGSLINRVTVQFSWKSGLPSVDKSKMSVYLFYLSGAILFLFFSCYILCSFSIFKSL